MSALAETWGERVLRRHDAPVDALAAILRWRLRRPTSFSAQARVALRLVPALLHASFPRADLRQEPPGLEGIAASRVGAGRTARELGLPPPSAGPRGRRLVQAVLAVPDGTAAQVLVLVAGTLSSEEQARLDGRLAAMRPLLHGACPGMTVEAYQRVNSHSELATRLLLEGILLAGRPAPGLFLDSGPFALAERAQAFGRCALQAPTPLCATALLLLSAPQTPPLPYLAVELMKEAVSARALADPEVLLALSAARSHPEGALCVELLSLVGSPVARALAQTHLRTADGEEDVAQLLGVVPATPISLEPSQQTAAGVMALSAKVARACVHAVRSIPKAYRPPFEAVLRREALSTGAARALLPLLGARLSSEGLMAGGNVVERKLRRVRELHDRSGACLGRGATSHQARIRALALIAAAIHRSPLPPSAGRAWERIAQRLAEAPARRTLLVVVYAERTAATQGDAPTLRVSRAVCVVLRPGGRPTSFRLSPSDAARRVTREALAGTVVETMSATGEAEPAALRLSQLAKLCAAHQGAQEFAVQSGDEVLWSVDGRVRAVDANRFLRRPRTTERLELGARPSALARTGLRLVTLECTLTLADAQHAWLAYRGHSGCAFGERVALADLDAHLRDSERLVRAFDTALTVRADDAFQKMSRRFGDEQAPTASVEVGGRLPHALSLSLNGETFGRGCPFGWEAAAEVALSLWPVGTRGRLSVSRVTLEGNASDTAPLFALYARSVALRRLAAHIRRLSRTP